MRQVVHAAVGTDGNPRLVCTKEWAVTGDVVLKDSDNSDVVTCKRCRTALAKAMPGSGSEWNSLAREIEDGKRQALVLADPDVAHAKAEVKRRLQRIKKLLDSAREDVERAEFRIDEVGIDTYGPLDIVMGDVARVPGFISNNMEIGSLAKEAVELQREIDRAARGERGWRGEIADRKAAEPVAEEAK